MYLRYTQPPGDLYDWYEDYLQDEEEIDVKAGGGQVLTIGQMVYQFMTKLDWFSTLFPRIPVPIQKQIEKRIEQYCREQGITVSQLSTGRPPAGTGVGAGGAAQEGEYQDYDASGGAGLAGDRGGGGGGRGHAMMGSGSRPGAYPPPMNNYRNDHDDRDYYAPTSGSSYGRGGRGGGYEDYPPAPLERERDRGGERDRDRDRDREKDYDRHRSKHKKKHKHRQSSRSRSRSRSRHRSERHERKREGVGGYERSSRSRHNDYEERDRRYR
ncbi:pre-mRNA-splicing factor 38B isoform X2 [Drosophila ananassae]|nr:pre-mRNA-splicing factor 38B isoform X2 [Drosophila ananassae]